MNKIKYYRPRTGEVNIVEVNNKNNGDGAHRPVSPKPTQAMADEQMARMSFVRCGRRKGTKESISAYQRVRRGVS